MPEHTDAEVEWAAECLWDLVEKHIGWLADNAPAGVPARAWSEVEPWFLPIQMDLARHALERGYQPPEKPKEMTTSASVFGPFHIGADFSTDDSEGVVSVFHKGEDGVMSQVWCARWPSTPKPKTVREELVAYIETATPWFKPGYTGHAGSLTDAILSRFSVTRKEG